MVENAARYGADLSRLVVAGESAGANLALGLTLSCCTERPEPFARAVFQTGVRPDVCLPACGLLQVSDPDRFTRRRPLSRFVQDRLADVSGGYLGSRTTELDLADPLVTLERTHSWARPLPPMFALCGTRDPLLDDSRRLVAALQARDVPAELHIGPGGIHAYHAFVWQAEARAAWAAQWAFVDRHLPAGDPGGDAKT